MSSKLKCCMCAACSAESLQLGGPKPSRLPILEEGSSLSSCGAWPLCLHSTPVTEAPCLVVYRLPAASCMELQRSRPAVTSASQQAEWELLWKGPANLQV